MSPPTEVLSINRRHARATCDDLSLEMIAGVLDGFGAMLDRTVRESVRTELGGQPNTVDGRPAVLVRRDDAAVLANVIEALARVVKASGGPR